MNDLIKMCFNRNINIRMWDKIEKRMIYLENFIAEMYCDLKNGDDWYDFQREYNVNDYIVMCGTGIKDMNGEEIYEGDIIAGNLIAEVMVDYYDGHGEIPQPGDVGEIFEVVKYRDGGYYPFMVWYRIYGWYDLSKIKVIGNIFENSELLK